MKQSTVGALVAAADRLGIEGKQEDPTCIYPKPVTESVFACESVATLVAIAAQAGADNPGDIDDLTDDLGRIKLTYHDSHVYVY